MGLTTAGLALVILAFLLFQGTVGRIGIVVAVLIGGLLPIADSIAAGTSEIVSAVAPLFNAIASGGGVFG